MTNHPTPADLPKQTDDALRLARLNLRSRFNKLASSTKRMDAETIELFHDLLDQARNPNLGQRR